MNEKIFLGKRRNRVIATILSFKERECDQYLPDSVSASLRAVILDEINDLCELAFDLIADDGPIMNEEFIDRLEILCDRVLENPNE